MNADSFYKIHLERDIKVLLAHYKNEKKLGNGADDILNAVFVGSLVKGRLFLDMLGIKANKKTKKVNFHRSNPDDITADIIGGRLANENDLTDYEKEMLNQFLTAVNKAEAHRDGSEENRDGIIHPSILLILKLVNMCIYQHAGRQIGYGYARKLLK